MGRLGFSCPTPVHLCFGSFVTDGIGGANKTKYHRDNIEGQNCYGKYLVGQGYEKLSRRDFKGPDGWVHTLPKKIGVPVISGKGGDNTKSKRAQGQHRYIGAR